jgi:hypothetical protein
VLVPILRVGGGGFMKSVAVWLFADFLFVMCRIWAGGLLRDERNTQ